MKTDLKRVAWGIAGLVIRLFLVGDVALGLYWVVRWAGGKIGGGRLGETITAAIAVLVIGVLLMHALRRVPAQPYTRVVRTIFGIPYRVPPPFSPYPGPGLHFFLGHPILFGFVAFNATEQNVDLEPKDIVTRDGVQLLPQLSYGFVPKRLKKVLEVGGIERVKNFLDDIFESVMRVTARGIDTYDQYLDLRDDVVKKMIRAAWEKHGPEGVPSKKDIDGIFNGDPLELDLGVDLIRINLGQIGIPEKLLESMLRDAEERAQSAAEERELKFVRDEALKFMAASPDVTFEQAMMYVQTERPQTAGDPKVKKEIREVRLATGGGVNLDLASAVGAIATAIVESKKGGS